MDRQLRATISGWASWRHEATPRSTIEIRQIIRDAVERVLAGREQLLSERIEIRRIDASH
jgi:ribonuclease PH